MEFKHIDDKYFVYKPNENQIALTYGSKDFNSKHIVMWSGGTDSTLLLYELLQTYGSENVTAISYQYPWLLSTKIEMENRYRELFKSKLKVSDPKLANFNHAIMKINLDKISGSMPSFQYGKDIGFIQACSWLLSVPQLCPDDSYVYTGDIVNDQLDSIKQTSLYELFDGISGVMGKNLHLRRPYLLFEKYQVIRKLIEYNIYDSTWFCEMSNDTDNKICGICNPCKLHLSALNTLGNIDNDTPELVRLIAKQQYEKLMNNRTSVKLYDKKEDKEYTIENKKDK